MIKELFFFSSLQKIFYELSGFGVYTSGGYDQKPVITNANVSVASKEVNDTNETFNFHEINPSSENLSSLPTKNTMDNDYLPENKLHKFIDEEVKK